MNDTCLWPCPLNSWWNSAPFLCKALVCRSSRTRVGYLQIIRTVFYTEMEKMCRTREWHVSRVWDHVHWIPGQILPHFHVRHLSVGHLEPELEIHKKLEQSSIPNHQMCRTREWHVSRVWDHVHWIPGQILPHFHVRHLSVGHLEPELEIHKKLEQSSIPNQTNTFWTHEIHRSRVWDHVHWIPGEILPHLYVTHLSVGHLEPELETYKNLEQSSIPKWKINVSDTGNTRVTFLGPCPMNSWWNSTQYLCKVLEYCTFSTKVRKSAKIRTVLERLRDSNFIKNLKIHAH